MRDVDRIEWVKRLEPGRIVGVYRAQGDLRLRTVKRVDKINSSGLIQLECSESLYTNEGYQLGGPTILGPINMMDVG